MPTGAATFRWSSCMTWVGPPAVVISTMGRTGSRSGSDSRTRGISGYGSTVRRRYGAAFGAKVRSPGR